MIRRTLLFVFLLFANNKANCTGAADLITEQPAYRLSPIFISTLKCAQNVLEKFQYGIPFVPIVVQGNQAAQCLALLKPQKIHYLTIEDSDITDADLQGLQDLKKIHLRRCPMVTGEFLSSICNLEEIQVFSCTLKPDNLNFSLSIYLPCTLQKISLDIYEPIKPLLVKQLGGIPCARIRSIGTNEKIISEFAIWFYKGSRDDKDCEKQFYLNLYNCCQLTDTIFKSLPPIHHLKACFCNKLCAENLGFNCRTLKAYNCLNLNLKALEVMEKKGCRIENSSGR